MVTRIFFVRHGEVINPDKICYGRLPGFPLSPLGEKEIANTAQLLLSNSISVIYASPILRTKQTAEIIGNVLNLPIQYSNDLLEVNTPMEGKPIAYIHSNTVKYDIFASDENKTGETIQDVALRMQKFINEMRKNYAGKNIVAVTHGDPIMIAKTITTGLPLTLDSLRPIDTGRYIQHGEIYATEFNS